MKENFRIERDAMGEIAVPAGRLWGAQTQRSLENFTIGTEKMPGEIIKAFALVKKAAAQANRQLGLLDDRRANVIIACCDEIWAGQWAGEFPLVVWQTGSGTQTNMNLNEVIARRANQLLDDNTVHPNDTVNLCQSSNDTFPTALHVAAVLGLEDDLLPALRQLENTLGALSARYADVIKLGRTHLQDATPMTLGQEIGGWQSMLAHCRDMITVALEGLKELAIGGTAVGTGLNAHPRFGEICAGELSRLCGRNFTSAENKFHALTSRDALVFAHGALKALAADLMKIANDIRWLASGPRGGLGELILPENEPGSSIMPGKVNPTQCEAVTMVAVRVMGNDTVIGIAASQGNFELNVFLPVMADAFLQSVRLLTDAMNSFEKNCVAGIEPNREIIRRNLENSLMLATALSPHIGYEKTALVAQTAHRDGITLREAATRLGLLSGEEFDRLVRPENMTGQPDEKNT